MKQAIEKYLLVHNKVHGFKVRATMETKSNGLHNNHIYTRHELRSTKTTS
jgi:hypothetical protein